MASLDDPNDAVRYSLLERNWRRVASTHTIKELMEADNPSKDEKIDVKCLLFGLLLIVAGILIFVCGVGSIVVLPALSPMENKYLRMIQTDRYYQLLIPITIPVTFIAIFVNWFSMKLFKHNA